MKEQSIMKYVFGPVPSRRLGKSLGIDPLPMKQCNWNCIYCQLGSTSTLTNERRDYFPSEEIVAEVQTVLASHGPGQIDWLTFVGSGEPTLHASLGRMISEVKSFTDIPVAIITNGSLLYLPEVRRDLLAADAVLPTLDAGSERLYQRIARPSRELTFAKLVDGLIAFRQEFTGQLWIEVMLLRGLNDTTAALSDLAEVISRIQPDQVHINLPVRPPAVEAIEVPDNESLARAQAILGNVTQVIHPADVVIDLGPNQDLAAAILGLVERHPMTSEELTSALDHEAAGIADALNELQSRGSIQKVLRHSKHFWASANSRYVKQPSAVR